MASKQESKQGRSSSARRDDILRIAAQTFAERGFSASTVREIAERASTLSGSLYYHFDSKEQMVKEVVGVYLDELIEAYREIAAGDLSAEAKIRELFAVSLILSDQRSDEVIILFQDWPVLLAFDFGLSDRMLEVESIWVAVIEAGMRSGEFDEALDSHLVYRTVMGAIAWVPRWFDRTGRTSIDELARFQADLFLSGLCRTPRRRAAKKVPASR